MLHERATAIWIPLQKRRRLQTSGSRMPSGMKSKTLPRAFRTQNARAVEPLGRLAVEQVSDAGLGSSSTLTMVSTTEREGRLGLSETAARPER